MDFATVIGFVLGFFCIISAMLMGGKISQFIDIPGLIVVIGGSVGTLFIKYPMGDVFRSVSVILRTFLVSDHESPEKMIRQLIDLANIARKDGILALEKVRVTNAFLQAAINHCVDGAEPEFLAIVLEKEVKYLEKRHQKYRDMFDGFAEAAPAMGMVATLIGLIHMFAHMSDPSSLGPAMSVALSGTMYGAIIANLCAVPIAKKLEIYSEEEVLVRHIIIDGMLGIQKGINPRMIQESLKSALPPKEREGIV